MPRVPELLAPAGSAEAARAAIANGADAVYLGVERFNARDEGAQLGLDDLAEVCRLAHQHGRRIYLTLNTLLKPHELPEALDLLGECLDRGIDAVIVQDVGLIRLAPRVYPGVELHGSTQMTVHDASGAALLQALGLQRVVLARENTLDDIRVIRDAVPDLGVETFIHGALCISYSGQCYMSGLISERSANRGSCAQSCRKDYVLTDAVSGDRLDAGYLISARDLAAGEHLEAIARLGICTLKVEGRKKRPEYVATVTRNYRAMLDRLRRGEPASPTTAETDELVQIYSRGFTAGMFGGRAGRDYVTRDQPDNRGVVLGAVVRADNGELLVDVSSPIEPGDGIALERPNGSQPIGFTVTGVRTLAHRAGITRQAIASHVRVPPFTRVVRTSQASLLARSRATSGELDGTPRRSRTRVDATVRGRAGEPLELRLDTGRDSVTLRGEVALVRARAHALDQQRLRQQLGRLGETPFALGAIDTRELEAGLFLPLSELNAIRQRAVSELLARHERARQAEVAKRAARIRAVVSAIDAPVRKRADATVPRLCADVYRVEDARAAAESGADEVAFDPFLRHPTPPLARVRALADELSQRGITLRLRTPTIVRPAERQALERWLDLGLPVLSGHLGLVAELARDGRDVVADYAVNCFNHHTAAEYFRLGASRIVLSVELTADEMAAVVAPWDGAGFDVVVYGRPEGMTIEHCVLSAAFARQPTTCRDLCVQKHPLVELTDPAGYTFPVATDAACRNRLLHSRPIEASEFVPRLWAVGLRSYRLLFNVPGDPVAEIVRRHRALLDALGAGTEPPVGDIRALVGSGFTRGHFARAV